MVRPEPSMDDNEAARLRFLVVTGEGGTTSDSSEKPVGSGGSRSPAGVRPRS